MTVPEIDHTDKSMVESASARTRWPKPPPLLTEEQEHIREDFYKHWLTVLPNRYGLIERFNHTYPLRSVSVQARRALEIGVGRGAHLSYENLDTQEYVGLELRPELAKIACAAYPKARVVVGDCQETIGFPDGYFDRVLAIHVLEHLPDLPRALDEIQRVLSPSGLFSVVIPCEGGLAYALARNISARRIFEKRYKQSYDWFVACEHINLPDEIISELLARFQITDKTYFPLVIPIQNLNLVIGFTLAHQKEARET